MSRGRPDVSWKHRDGARYDLRYRHRGGRPGASANHGWLPQGDDDVDMVVGLNWTINCVDAATSAWVAAAVGRQVVHIPQRPVRCEPGVSPDGPCKRDTARSWRAGLNHLTWRN